MCRYIRKLFIQFVSADAVVEDGKAAADASREVSFRFWVNWNAWPFLTSIVLVELRRLSLEGRLLWIKF